MDRQASLLLSQLSNCSTEARKTCRTKTLICSCSVTSQITEVFKIRSLSSCRQIITCSVRACSRIVFRFSQAWSSPNLASSSWLRAFWISIFEV